MFVATGGASCTGALHLNGRVLMALNPFYMRFVEDLLDAAAIPYNSSKNPAAWKCRWYDFSSEIYPGSDNRSRRYSRRLIHAQMWVPLLRRPPGGNQNKRRPLGESPRPEWLQVSE